MWTTTRVHLEKSKYTRWPKDEIESFQINPKSSIIFNISMEFPMKNTSGGSNGQGISTRHLTIPKDLFKCDVIQNIVPLNSKEEYTEPIQNVESVKFDLDLVDEKPQKIECIVQDIVHSSHWGGEYTATDAEFKMNFQKDVKVVFRPTNHLDKMNTRLYVNTVTKCASLMEKETIHNDDGSIESHFLITGCVIAKMNAQATCLRRLVHPSIQFHVSLGNLFANTIRLDNLDEFVWLNFLPNTWNRGFDCKLQIEAKANKGDFEDGKVFACVSFDAIIFGDDVRKEELKKTVFQAPHYRVVKSCPNDIYEITEIYLQK